LQKAWLDVINKEADLQRQITLEQYKSSAEQTYRERARAFYENLEAKGINTSAKNCDPVIMFDAYFTTEIKGG
jgi:hypothetical protein